MKRYSSFVIGIWAILLPALVLASPIKVQIRTGIDTSVTILTILNGLVNIMLYWGGSISTAVFMLGAFTMVASAGNDEYLSMGKTMMKSAAMGLAIILGSWMMLSTMVYFIYGF
jgi:hypothetical protein